jgi:putative hemolysin
LLNQHQLFLLLQNTDFFNGSINLFEISIQLLIMVLGLILSGLFSSSEVSFFSLTPHQVQDEVGAKHMDPSLHRIVTMLDRPRRLLATILIGNTFANIVTSVMAAVITGNLVHYFGAPEILTYFVEVIVVTFTIVILSEITPKVIAIKNPMALSRKLSGFIYSFFILMRPLAQSIANSTLRLERYLPKPQYRISSHDIKHIAEVGEKQGSLKGDEREIIENVIEFGNMTVREIMTSRVNIVAVATDDSLGEVLKLIKEKSLSRLQLYENELDNIVGVIYAKDLLPYLDSSHLQDMTINWRTMARKALFIPSSKKLDDLLQDFQREKTHMAIVVDEYGGTEGLITLDDVLSEIIGELTDEHTETEQLYTRLRSDVYIFDAKIDLDDMSDILEKELTSEEDDYETLGGLIYHLTEHIPDVGEKVHFKGLELTVHEVDNNRVKKVKVRLLPEEEQSENTSLDYKGETDK